MQQLQQQIAAQKATIATLSTQQTALSTQIASTKTSLAGVNADLAAVRLAGGDDAPELLPHYDAASHLVYAAARSHVTDVWVAGRHLLQSGMAVPAAFRGLDTRAHLWQNTLKARPES